MERVLDERLAVSLTLTIAGKAFKIPAGDLKRFSVDLWSWGLDGEVEFLVTDNASAGGKSKDKLLAPFLKPDLVQVSLEVMALLSETGSQVKPTALKIQGLVTEKTLVEEPVSTGGTNAILHRRYGVRFMDAARVLWTQHSPCVLYTQKSMKDVLEAHKGDKITLGYDWDVLTKTHPMLFVGGMAPERGCTFYDWVLWYVTSHNGVFTYDYKKHGYKLATAKDASGTPLALHERDLAELEVLLPEVIRHDVTVLNALAEGPKTEALTQKQAVTGIRQDVLLCTPISDEMQARVKLETARLKPRGPEMELRWASFPAAAFTPGALVKLPPNPAWGAAGLAKDEVLRVRSLHLSGEIVAETEGQEEAYGDSEASFYFQMSTRLEPKAELHVDLPAWQAPHHPQYVEGLIVSELGADEDETWQAYTDSATSLDGYKVKIPLYEDQVIAAPFNPNLLPGHFYFPAYKGERVLVALDFKRAWIKRFLDWRTGARMPQDGQGVQLLVGKTPENGTAIKHFYTDDKPVFLMQRTNEKDTQKIQLDEGTLLIQVKEEQS